MKKLQNKKVAFPHMGNYSIPVKYLLENALNATIVDIPKITNKTIEIGTRHSPEFVCTPFKYTLGTLLESLEEGADILIQAGGGCRYGYYSELQEKILKDLDYNFEFVNFVSGGHNDIKQIYKGIKKINNKFSSTKGLYYLFITKKIVKYMDLADNYIRENIGFEVEKDSFINIQEEMLDKFSKVRNPISIYILYKRYMRKFKKIKIDKPRDYLKVGLIGELYTIMEPFANYELEKILASYGMSIKRYTNVHYLLFEKKEKIKKYIKYANKYVKYKMGADASDNIGRTKYLCEQGYDGIIHIKSTFCTPEIGAMPVINKVCNDYKMPLLFFSFDLNTSEVGVQTRIEAFYDMIERKRENAKILPWY